MLTDGRDGLSFIEVEGTPYEIGARLGRRALDIVSSHLVKTHAWASVMAFRRDSRMLAAKTLVETRFPRYWQELRGLADGLALPFDDVFAWNNRGDLWAMAPDGCTTVQMPGNPHVLAHNEDGHAGLRSSCALALIRSEGGKAFTAFVYPASLPGHTFAVTEAGLVQTVNNIRSRRGGDGLPRMALTRAVLDCDDMDEAVALIANAPRAGGFHLSLAQSGDPRLLSVEFTHTRCSVEPLSQPRCHANHLIHSDTRREEQLVTASSRARQARGEELVGDCQRADIDPLTVLRDRASAALPIYREQPDDPDDENTLATAVIEIGADGVSWRVYDRIADQPAYAADHGLIPSRQEPAARPDRVAQVQ